MAFNDLKTVMNIFNNIKVKYSQQYY